MTEAYLYNKNDEEWHDGQHVEDVHDVLAEGELGRAGNEAQDELYGEPRDADRLYDEEGVVVVGNQVGRVAASGDIEAGRALEVGQRLETEVDDGRHDAGDGDDGKYTGRQRAGRLLTEQPQGALPANLHPQQTIGLQV